MAKLSSPLNLSWSSHFWIWNLRARGDAMNFGPHLGPHLTESRRRVSTMPSDNEPTTIEHASASEYVLPAPWQDFIAVRWLSESI